MDALLMWITFVVCFLGVLLIGALIADFLYPPTEREDWLDE